MDILCSRCGEPWETYYVQHDMIPQERDRFWAGKGCPCCEGKAEEEFAGRAERTSFARLAQRELKAVLGDDVDRLAALMEDFGLS